MYADDYSELVVGFSGRPNEKSVKNARQCDAYWESLYKDCIPDVISYKEILFF